MSLGKLQVPKIALLILVLFFQGCAFSGLMQSEYLQARASEGKSYKEANGIKIETHCGQKTYSLMASPIIPLPPIIPIFAGSQPKLFITSPPNISNIEVSLTKENGELQHIEFVEQRPEWQGNGLVSFYKINGSCEALSDSELHLKFINDSSGQTYHQNYKVEYSTGEIELEWWYLSA